MGSKSQATIVFQSSQCFEGNKDCLKKRVTIVNCNRQNSDCPLKNGFRTQVNIPKFSFSSLHRNLLTNLHRMFRSLETAVWSSQEEQWCGEKY